MKLHVTCNTDANFIQHCCSMLCSLFENNNKHEIHVHLLHKDLPQNSIDFLTELVSRYCGSISFYQIDEDMLGDVVYRYKYKLTKAAYYRLLLPTYIDTSIKTILYLDCDIIVCGDVSELFQIDMTGFGVAACEDVAPYSEDHRRQLNFDINDKEFCSGIMYINLDYWRNHDIQNRAIEFAQRQRTPVYLQDQDALNYVLKKHWLVLPPKWNKSPMSIAPTGSRLPYSDKYEYMYEPKILHYAGRPKPWENISFPEKKPYVKYLKMSGYPNPEFRQISFSLRVHTIVLIIRYIINKYIRPFTPQILEMLCKDVYRLITMLLLMFRKSESRKNIILTFWLDKYK